MSEIILTPAALTLVKNATANGRKDARIADAYVAEMGVTVETVADHVAIFRDHFRASFPKSAPADPADVKAHANLWRNRLNRSVGKPAADPKTPDLLALLVKAAENAAEGGVPADEIRKALANVLK